jgi:hypothetical protein
MCLLTYCSFLSSYISLYKPYVYNLLMVMLSRLFAFSSLSLYSFELEINDRLLPSLPLLTFLPVCQPTQMSCPICRPDTLLSVDANPTFYDCTYIDTQPVVLILVLFTYIWCMLMPPLICLPQ